MTKKPYECEGCGCELTNGNALCSYCENELIDAQIEYGDEDN
ncbi:hypothetical protein AAHB53_28150 [Niallia circulans]